MSRRERSFSMYSWTSEKTFNDDNLSDITFIKRNSNIFDLNEPICEETDFFDTSLTSSYIIDDKNDFKIHSYLNQEKQTEGTEGTDDLPKPTTDKIRNDRKNEIQYLLEKRKMILDKKNKIKAVYNSCDMGRKNKITDILYLCDTSINNIEDKINNIMKVYPDINISELNIPKKINDEIHDQNSHKIIHSYLESFKACFTEDEVLRIKCQKTVESKAIALIDVAFKYIKNQEQEIVILQDQKQMLIQEKVDAVQGEIKALVEEKNKLSDEKDKLLEEVANKNFELNKLLEEVANKNFEKDKLLEEVASKNFEKDKLLEEVASKNFEKDKLLEEVASQNFEKDKLLEEVQNKNFELDTLKKKYEVQSSVMEKSVKELDSAKELINNFNREKRLWKEATEEKEKEIINLNKTRVKQLNEMNELNSKYENLLSEHDKILRENKVVNKARSDLMGKHQEMTCEINYLKETNEKQKLLNREYGKQLESAQEEIESLRGEKEHLRMDYDQKLKMAEMTLESSRHTETMVKEDNDKLKGTIATMTNEMASLRETNEEQHSQIKNTEDKLKETLGKLEIAMEETRNSLLVINSKEKEIAHLQNKNEKLTNHVTNLQNQKDTLLKTIEEEKMKSDLENLEWVRKTEYLVNEEKDKLDAVIQNLNEEIAYLNEQNREKESSLEACRDALEQATKEIERIEKSKKEEMATLQAETDRLKRVVESQIKKIDKREMGAVDAKERTLLMSRRMEEQQRVIEKLQKELATAKSQPHSEWVVPTPKSKMEEMERKNKALEKQLLAQQHTINDLREELALAKTEVSQVHRKEWMIPDPESDSSANTREVNIHEDNTREDNTRENNIRIGNTNDDNTREDNILSDNTNGDNIRSGNTNDDNTSGNNIRGDNIRGDNTRSGNTTSDEYEDEDNGDDQQEIEWDNKKSVMKVIKVKQREIKSLTNENKKLSRSLEKLEGKLMNGQKELQSKTRTIKEMKKTVETLKKENKSKESLLEKANKKIGKCENEIESLKEENMALQSELEDDDGMKKYLMMNLKREVENLQNTVDGIIDENVCLKEKLTQKRNGLTSLCKEISQAKREFKEYLIDLEEVYPELKPVNKEFHDPPKLYHLFSYSLEHLTRLDELNPHLEMAFSSIKNIFDYADQNNTII